MRIRSINDILAIHLPLAERAELPGAHSAPAEAQEEFVGQIKAFLAQNHDHDAR